MIPNGGVTASILPFYRDMGRHSDKKEKVSDEANKKVDKRSEEDTTLASVGKKPCTGW